MFGSTVRYMGQEGASVYWVLVGLQAVIITSEDLHFGLIVIAHQPCPGLLQEVLPS